MAKTKLVCPKCGETMVSGFQPYGSKYMLSEKATKALEAIVVTLTVGAVLFPFDELVASGAPLATPLNPIPTPSSAISA